MKNMQIEYKKGYIRNISIDDRKITGVLEWGDEKTNFFANISEYKELIQAERDCKFIEATFVYRISAKTGKILGIRLITIRHPFNT